MPPAPKRSTERRRRNKESQPHKVVATGKVKRPPASSHWHPIAKSWYTALGDSGQAQFFEPSDWQAARYVAEVMSRHLKRKQPSAQLFSSIWSAMGDLLTTEAQRRRLRIEVEREKPPPATEPGVTALDDYRRQLGA